MTASLITRLSEGEGALEHDLRQIARRLLKRPISRRGPFVIPDNTLIALITAKEASHE